MMNHQDEYRFMDYELPYERKSRGYQGDLLPDSRKKEIKSFIQYWCSLTDEEKQELLAKKGSRYL